MIVEKYPKISVVVPVYEAEKYLRPCVDSLLSQSYENIEVILIDDGSPDNSGSICDEYAKKDSRILVFHQENQGVSKTRNFGIQQADGDYIVFVDADDLVQPEYIEQLYKTLPYEEKNAIAMCGLQNLVDGDLTIKEEPLADYEIGQDSLYERYLEPLITRRIHGSSCRIIYPTEFLRTHHISFSQCKIAEDLLFLLEVISRCRCIRVCKDHLYLYRQISQSSSHRAYITNYLPDRLLYMKKLQQILESLDLKEEQRDWLLSFSFQFYRMILYMNATASPDVYQEVMEIDRSPFGMQKVSRTMEKKFSSEIGEKHRTLNFLCKYRMFTLIAMIRNHKKMLS